MKLINPGSGDFIDQYSILALKMHHRGQSEGVLALESDGILDAAPWIDKRLDLAMKIMMVNTLMWVATDELDEAISDAALAGSSSSYEHMGHVAKRLRRLNLKRAALVNELSRIDEAIEEEAEEKV